eukprot:CAMPEP_0175156360 /NCGR_PEP_ID=MMETSP0087-20121206/21550_1 /TAXON_ID=136419 /ORGANISM="Unknown Unknown, Strain D1" /LENGTH=471 /DNA_ID=CAMNT_0016443743 /DNA_START=170 /DNA_END=1583 /DNA_ORIENTATION=+
MISYENADDSRTSKTTSGTQQTQQAMDAIVQEQAKLQEQADQKEANPTTSAIDVQHDEQDSDTGVGTPGGNDNEVDKLLQTIDLVVSGQAPRRRSLCCGTTALTETNSWKHRFYDYLDALGLKAAVRATEFTEVQETKRAVQREQSRSLVSDLRDREDDRPRWCAAYQTLKTSLSTGNYQTYVVYEAEANPDQDFFDLWAKCLQLIGATGRYQNLTYARTALDTDTLQQGDTITSLAQRIQSRVATVNSMAGNRVISDQDANYHLLKAVKGSPYSNCFQTANTKAESNYPNWTWATMVQKFVVYSPKDVLGREMPMGPRHENEKPVTESLAMAAEPQGTRPNVKEKCGFCERQGHKESECRNKAFAKAAYMQGQQQPQPRSRTPNAQHNMCLEWQSKGSCSWEDRMGRPCRFRHGDAKGGDQANAAEPPPQGSADIAAQSEQSSYEAQGHAAMSAGDDSLQLSVCVCVCVC